MQTVIASILLFASTAYIIYIVFFESYKIVKSYGRGYKTDMPHSHIQGVLRLFIPSGAMALGLTLLTEGSTLSFVVLTLIIALIYLVWSYLTFRAILKLFSE